MTREHIWPRGILDRAKQDLRYSGKAQKLIRADLVVKDVCARCNNEYLSALDAYFCSLYDQYFEREIRENEPVNLKYDFGLLCRALLKIAYNSSRTTGIDEQNLRDYAPIIKTPNTSPLGVFIKVATIKPATLRNGTKLPAKATRCGPFEILGRNKNGLSTRLIQINSFRFNLVITNSITDRALAVRYLANELGTWIRREGETLIPFPTLDTMQAFQGIQNWRA